VTLGGRNALRETATLEVVSRHLNIVPCETTSTERERKAYARQTTHFQDRPSESRYYKMDVLSDGKNRIDRDGSYGAGSDCCA
jgi:hypothetical protein